MRKNLQLRWSWVHTKYEYEIGRFCYDFHWNSDKVGLWALQASIWNLYFLGSARSWLGRVQLALPAIELFSPSWTSPKLLVFRKWRRSFLENLRKRCSIFGSEQPLEDFEPVPSVLATNHGHASKLILNFPLFFTWIFFIGTKVVISDNPMGCLINLSHSQGYLQNELILFSVKLLQEVEYSHTAPRIRMLSNSKRAIYF